MRAATEAVARRDGTETRGAVEELRRDLETVRAAIEGEQAVVADRVGSLADAVRRTADQVASMRAGVDAAVHTQHEDLSSAVLDVEAMVRRVHALSESMHSSLLGVDDS